MGEADKWCQFILNVKNGTDSLYPFDWMMPENVQKKGGYTYVMFLVVYASDTAPLPPAQNYGN